MSTRQDKMDPRLRGDDKDEIAAPIRDWLAMTSSASLIHIL